MDRMLRDQGKGQKMKLFEYYEPSEEPLPFSENISSRSNDSFRALKPRKTPKLDQQTLSPENYEDESELIETLQEELKIIHVESQRRLGLLKEKIDFEAALGNKYKKEQLKLQELTKEISLCISDSQLKSKFLETVKSLFLNAENEREEPNSILINIPPYVRTSEEGVIEFRNIDGAHLISVQTKNLSANSIFVKATKKSMKQLDLSEIEREGAELSKEDFCYFLGDLIKCLPL